MSAVALLRSLLALTALLMLLFLATPRWWVILCAEIVRSRSLHENCAQPFKFPHVPESAPAGGAIAERVRERVDRGGLGTTKAKAAHAQDVGDVARPRSLIVMVVVAAVASGAVLKKRMHENLLAKCAIELFPHQVPVVPPPVAVVGPGHGRG